MAKFLDIQMLYIIFYLSFVSRIKGYSTPIHVNPLYIIQPCVNLGPPEIPHDTGVNNHVSASEPFDVFHSNSPKQGSVEYFSTDQTHEDPRMRSILESLGGTEAVCNPFIPPSFDNNLDDEHIKYSKCTTKDQVVNLPRSTSGDEWGMSLPYHPIYYTELGDQNIMTRNPPVTGHLDKQSHIAGHVMLSDQNVNRGGYSSYLDGPLHSSVSHEGMHGRGPLLAVATYGDGKRNDIRGVGHGMVRPKQLWDNLSPTLPSPDQVILPIISQEHNHFQPQTTFGILQKAPGENYCDTPSQCTGCSHSIQSGQKITNLKGNHIYPLGTNLQRLRRHTSQFSGEYHSDNINEAPIPEHEGSQYIPYIRNPKPFIHRETCNNHFEENSVPRKPQHAELYPSLSENEISVPVEKSRKRNRKKSLKENDSDSIKPKSALKSYFLSSWGMIEIGKFEGLSSKFYDFLYRILQRIFPDQSFIGHLQPQTLSAKNLAQKVKALVVDHFFGCLGVIWRLGNGQISKKEMMQYAVVFLVKYFKTWDRIPLFEMNNIHNSQGKKVSKDQSTTPEKLLAYVIGVRDKEEASMYTIHGLVKIFSSFYDRQIIAF